MSMFEPAPKPKSVLGYHRLLAPTAAVRVSPICLGTMNFGEAWAGMLGECDKKTSFEILDYFFDNGGNFLDTANNYQSEETETWVGEWIAKRQNRDQLVIATKYTSGFRGAHRDTEIMSNFQGNSAKSLHVSLKASLKKLQTDYIDLLYVHWWDFSTGIEELMQSLNTVVQQGKVLYLGVSDTPAWVVAKANEYARQRGFRQFSVYQGRWSAAKRDFEREIIPMCEAEGMGLAPWGALGGGSFKTKEQRETGEGRKMAQDPSETDVKVSEVLEKIAKRKNSIMTSIAMAYVMHKTPNVFPIVGGRKIDHLKGNIEALKLELSDEEIDEIENAAPFDPGFPMNFAYMKNTSTGRLNTGDVTLVKSNAHIDAPPRQRPIKPRQE